MKLYFTPGACSLSPHIVLREAQLSFELEQVDLTTKQTEAGADFTRINPKGQVPALQLDGGDVLTEVPAILQYIADLVVDSRLAPPATSGERYRLQEWLNFITAELHKSFSPLFRPDLPASVKPMLQQAIAAKFDYLDHHLAKQDFLMGKHFSVADSYAFTVVNWSKLFDMDLSRWPNLERYMHRIAARPSVQESMQAEGLSGG